ncbi:MAG: N-acetylmuramoyl-L-alanine amidase [Luteolibacter sp.]
MTTPLIALCVGHSRELAGRRDGGAVSVGGISEWEYNAALAPLIAGHLERYGIRSVIVEHYQGHGYTAAMRWLAEHLRDLDVAAALELHFNAAGPTARGHEWLHWHSSRRARALAVGLDYEMRLQVPPAMLPARGPKPRTPSDRGAEFLRLTHCPAVIAEPFFGSNVEDWKIATRHQSKIALAIANGIDAWIEGEG